MGMTTLSLFDNLPEASGRWDFRTILLADDNWERYQIERADQLRPIEFEEVTKMLSCGDPKAGFVTLLCLKCGTEKRVPFTCKSRLCSRCGKRHTDQWSEQIGSMLKAEIDAAATDYGVNVRAVRITDVTAPPSLIEELAVIARAERSAKAKLIQAEAEKAVATALAEASQTLEGQEGTMQLRQIQALLEMSKEESAMIIIYPMDSLAGSQIAGATAGAQSRGKGPKVIPAA